MKGVESTRPREKVTRAIPWTHWVWGRRAGKTKSCACAASETNSEPYVPFNIRALSILYPIPLMNHSGTFMIYKIFINQQRRSFMIHKPINPTTIGIDLAKNIFHLHALDEKGDTLWRKTIRVQNAIAVLQELSPCIIGIEACSGSHYWHRTFSSLGHGVRMITPQRAKAFRERQKNDKNDAEAIAHAVMNRQTRWVVPKSIQQQEMTSLHAMRSLHVRQRTQLISHMRGTLNEYGITCQQGAKVFENHIEEILQQAIEHDKLPALVAQGIISQIAFLKLYRDQIRQFDLKIATLAQNDPCQRLMTMPGVGIHTSTMLYAHGGNVKQYKKSGEFAASLGLVPRQHSTGGKQSYGGISKRGNRSLRTNLIHGARSALIAASRKRKAGKSLENALLEWGLQCLDRMGMKRAAVALANKMGRIAWHILKTPEEGFMPSMAV